LKDLIEKLEPQQQFIESEVEELSKPEFSELKDVQGLIEPLRKYLLFVHALIECCGSCQVRDLEHLHDRLNTLRTRYSNHGTTKRIKTVLMAESDKDQIAGYVQKLEDSFRHFMARDFHSALYATNSFLELSHESHCSPDATHA
jgi:hypothetical protein